MQPYLTAKNITIRNGTHFFFENTSWEMQQGQHWLFVGENGAGKSTLAKAIAGQLPLKYGEIIAHFGTGKKYKYSHLHKDKIQYISFDTEQNILTQLDKSRDLASFVGKELDDKTVSDYLGTTTPKVITKFGIASFLNDNITTLSTGELRKVFLVKAALQNPTLLILDEPFNGLDKSSRDSLLEFLKSFSESTQIILITHHIYEIPEFITHVMYISDSKIVDQGRKVTMVEKYPQFFKMHIQKISLAGKLHKSASKEILIAMKNVSVSYGTKKVLDNISWTVRSGENWAVLGPNGAGKSTLMKLITGDSLQVHANDIALFGKDRSSISLWEIRKFLGYVSSELQLRYQIDITVRDVVLSGFFDSIGLYQIPTPEQITLAEKWIKKLDIGYLADKKYKILSNGQKRLVLIARAVVKTPKLLILDEPCQNLDQSNRKKILNEINTIAGTVDTSIILITHHDEELVPNIKHVLKLEKGRIVS